MTLRITIELLVSLRYKLVLFGIPFDGPAYIFFDNQYVTNNMTLPQSVFNNRCNAIYYHRFCKAKAAYIIIIVWIQLEYNQSGLGAEMTLITNKR